jgi:hypothetical protein
MSTEVTSKSARLKTSTIHIDIPQVWDPLTWTFKSSKIHTRL